MSKRYILINWIVLVTVCIIAGCRQKDTTNVLDTEPNLQKIIISSDYQAGAIEATGGLDAWAKVRKLQFDSLVTFYQPDGSFYLTRQKLVIYPWSNSIEIFGKEPKGSFAWRLSQGQFEVLRGEKQLPNFQNVIDNKCFMDAILSIITAPVRFLDKSVRFTRDSNPIKIQGRWYYPIIRQTREDIETIKHIPKAVFCQNRENAIIEMILFDCSGTNQSFAVRGYDYIDFDNDGIVLPQRIEIFQADSQNNSHRRLVKIDIQ